MQLFRFTRAILMISMLTLIYIHMQMQIFALAYQGRKRELFIARIQERNSALSSNILELKSSNNLGIRLLTKDSELRFLDQENVIQLVTSQPSSEQKLAASAEGKSGDLLSWIPFRGQAEARAAERTAGPRP
ncbi:MAG: hypothetical protein Q8Q08_08330 [Candidatus Omnitrophota bacterium]|nr:hypothetical protein [Candidatus Omnitrophota bacterium]MDZ4242770.1 hypothetical protein [Candidatus Omnitrophota bacterium]